MIKSVILFVSLTFISSFATSQKVANANIKFHTTNDDKDDDTHVTVEVKDGNGIVIARIDNDFGHFSDNSDSGPYDIPVANPSSKEECQGGTVKIHIDPNGHDTWHFNFFLTIILSNGKQLSGGADGLSLDQDRKEQIFGLSGLLKEPEN